MSNKIHLVFNEIESKVSSTKISDQEKLSVRGQLLINCQSNLNQNVKCKSVETIEAKMLKQFKSKCQVQK